MFISLVNVQRAITGVDRQNIFKIKYNQVDE
jgi:hypothetical protein